MAAAHLRAGTGAATAPPSPAPLLLSARRARGREAPPGSAPRVSSASRPVPRWNSAAAPSLPPVPGKGLRERLRGRHPRPLLTGQAAGTGGRTAPLRSSPRRPQPLRSGARRARGRYSPQAAAVRGEGRRAGPYLGGGRPAIARPRRRRDPRPRRSRGGGSAAPGLCGAWTARPSASLLPCPPRRSPPALTPPSGRGGCTPPGGARAAVSGGERRRRGFPHLRSAGWRRVAGRNMAGAAGGRSRWLRPVSCGARGSALRWCCAAGTGREVLAPCAPPCVVLPQPRTHVIHMAGAVRLRLSCDAREFREGACSGHYVAARLRALSGCFI